MSVAGIVFAQIMPELYLLIRTNRHSSAYWNAILDMGPQFLQEWQPWNRWASIPIISTSCIDDPALYHTLVVSGFKTSFGSMLRIWELSALRYFIVEAALLQDLCDRFVANRISGHPRNKMYCGVDAMI